MGFPNLIELALQAFGFLSEISKIVSLLSNEIENTKKEIKEKTGEEIDISLALLKVDGKSKFAIIVDLPNNVEDDIADILKVLGINIEVLEAHRVK